MWFVFSDILSKLTAVITVNHEFLIIDDLILAVFSELFNAILAFLFEPCLNFFNVLLLEPLYTRQVIFWVAVDLDGELAI